MIVIPDAAALDAAEAAEIVAALVDAIPIVVAIAAGASPAIFCDRLPSC